MRDILFKNTTSLDRSRRRVIVKEVSEKQGIRSIVQRHFIYKVEELTQQNTENLPPMQIYMVKERNTTKQKERFFCKIKGNFMIVKANKLFLVEYIHCLHIILEPLVSFKLA